MSTLYPATPKREQWLLILLLILAALSYRLLITGTESSPFLPTIVGSFFSYSGTSPQFIYLFVIGLIFLRRADIANAYHSKGSPWTALFYLVPGVCLFLWGQYVGVIDIIHISFLLIILGTARYLSGKELTRTILLPVLILVLATPLPAVLLNALIFPFQLWDAQHSTWLLNAAGIPALELGDIIHIGGRKVRVAESCTALGFLKWLTIIALTYAYIFSTSRLHTALLILSAPFIAYTVNLLRVLSLTLNPKLDILSIHTAQGIMFFMIGFLLLYAVDSMLLRTIGNNKEPDSPPKPENLTDTTSWQGQQPVLVIISLFSAMLLATFLMPRWTSSHIQTPDLVLTEKFKDWQLVTTQPLHYSFLGSVRYSKSFLRLYKKKNQSVSLFIGFDNRQDRHLSFLSDKNSYPDRIGRVEKRSKVNWDNTGHYANTILTRNNHRRTLVYYWYRGVDNIWTEIIYALLALDQSPFRRTAEALVVRLSTAVAPYPKGLEQAEQRLQDFITDITLTELNSAASKK